MPAIKDFLRIGVAPLRIDELRDRVMRMVPFGVACCTPVTKVSFPVQGHSTKTASLMRVENVNSSFRIVQTGPGHATLDP